MKVPRKPAAATPVQPVAQQVQPQQMTSSDGMQQTSQSKLICSVAQCKGEGSFADATCVSFHYYDNGQC